MTRNRIVTQEEIDKLKYLTEITPKLNIKQLKQLTGYSDWTIYKIKGTGFNLESYRQSLVKESKKPKEEPKTDKQEVQKEEAPQQVVNQINLKEVEKLLNDLITIEKQVAFHIQQLWQFEHNKQEWRNKNKSNNTIRKFFTGD